MNEAALLWVQITLGHLGALLTILVPCTPSEVDHTGKVFQHLFIVGDANIVKVIPKYAFHLPFQGCLQAFNGLFILCKFNTL
jgi:hypothetical protein